MTTINRNFVVKNGIEVATTASVTGATTLANTLSVSGLSTLSTANITGAATLNSTLAVTGLASFNGGVALGNATADQIAITGAVNTDIIPVATGLENLGNTSNRWLSVWANNLTVTTNVSAVGITARDMTLTGNLTVSGTTTYINTTDLNIGDNTIVLNADLGTGVAPSQDSGFTVNRGSAADVSFLWNESTDKWTLSNTSIDGTLLVSSSVNAASFTVGTTASVNSIAVAVGTINATSNGFLANSSTVTVGNTSVNTEITPVQIKANQNDTVSLPSYTWSGNTNTGFYRPTTATIGITTGGVERLRVGTTLLINTSANASSFTVGSNFIANATGVYHTGLMVSDGVVVRGEGATGEGGQITLGYGNNLASSITGQANNTFVIDIVGGNTGSTPILRTFFNNADGSTRAAFNIANTGRMHVGSLGEQTDSTFKVTGSANVTTSVNTALLTVGTNFIANTLGAYHTGTVNATSLTTTAFIANTTGVTVTGFANVSTSVNTALLTVGTSFIANTLGVYHTGTINSASVSTSTLLANTTAVTITGSGTEDALRITQTGTGNALVVEDSANPDSSPFVVDASGNVGIGIAAPTQKLHVAGNILATGSIDCGTQFLGLAADSATSPSFSFTGDTNTGIFRPAADQIGVTTGGTLRFTVNTTQITSTLPLLGQNGTAAAPSFSASADTNTGMYFPSADTLGLATAGVERLQVSSAGDVGIGITPTQKLHVSGNILATGSIDCGTQFLGLAADSATAPSFSFTGDTNTGMFRPAADQLALSVNGAARLTMTTGQITTTLALRGQNGSVAAPAFSASADTNTGMYFPSADTLGLATAGVERLQVNSSGALGVDGANFGSVGQILTSNGTSSAPYWAAPVTGVEISDDTSTNGTRYIAFANQTSGTITTAYVASTGLTFNPSTGDLTAGGNITAHSDERLKTDWEDLPTDFVEQLSLVKHGTYSRTDIDMRQVGVSAQSLQSVIPEAVLEGEYLSVSYGHAALAACIALAKEVTALKAELAELKSRVV